MSNLARAMMMGAAGASGDKVYVDDVFSTFLYDGNSSTQTITNGIDLSGEGGLVWIKARSGSDGTDAHNLFDTERGATFRLFSNNTNLQDQGNTTLTAFNSNGFGLGSQSNVNSSNSNYASWTFRKAPGFFDVVTWTGNNTAGRTISHSLGSVPGMIIVKRTDTTENWHVYHRSTGATKYLILDANNAEATGSSIWNDTTPTSTNFTVGTNGAVNASGGTYVAYIFAHDDAQFGTGGNESIIKCGSYTGTTSGVDLDLGFEPQWVMIKRASNSGTNYTNWAIFDNMRGVVSGGTDIPLAANLNTAENGTYLYGTANPANLIEFSPTGIRVDPGGSQFTTVCTNGENYIYTAIRRPHKPPEVGTEVFNAKLRTGTGTTGQIDSGIGFAPDLALIRARNVGTSGFFYDRLRGINYLQSSSTDQESPGGLSLTSATGTAVIGGSAGWHCENGRTHVDFYFKRAPGFFDVVTYTGDGSSNRQISHNLDAVPELMIVKQRDASREWAVYSAGIGVGKFLKLRENVALTTQSGLFDTAPTSSIFTVETNTYVNISSGNYIAYLFATLAGVSKVGSYTGTGNAINVDCGFTNGARFVLIKRADVGGDWDVMDSVRGIAIGNDKHIALNVNTAEGTSSDFIDPLNAGFIVSAAAPNDINQSGGTYIFLAIA